MWIGSEAVVESGGLINAVGSNQIAIIAKAANKPFYALAERCVRHMPILTETDFIFLQLQISSPFPLEHVRLAHA